MATLSDTSTMARNWTVFTTMDPLAEKYYGLSPYAYCGNNPVNAIDLRGDTRIIDKEGNLFNFRPFSY